jgi:nucleoside-diphosphate-sugar epimerase
MGGWEAVMKALVTGGGGFLGLAIVRLLTKHGFSVRSLARNHYSALEDLGVVQLQGNLVDQAAVLSATEGCDLVFHVAAKAGVWGLYEDYYRTNVIGTRHVIEACRRHGIRRLIYTSSPSVVLGDKELQGVNESTPYPTRYLAHYPATKAEAERQVLAANSPELATVVLRPHLIWGPGDNHLVPRILARGRAGRLRRLGHRNPLIDTTYIDDAARAHVLAADRLQPGSAVAGKVYFISSGQPIPL